MDFVGHYLNNHSIKNKDDKKEEVLEEKANEFCRCHNSEIDENEEYSNPKRQNDVYLIEIHRKQGTVLTYVDVDLVEVHVDLELTNNRGK